MKLGFARQIFLKNTHTPNFIKIRPVGAELFHAERRGADRCDKVNSSYVARIIQWTTQ